MTRLGEVEQTPRPAVASACRVARIARTLAWERALRSAREQDERIEPSFAHAPTRSSRRCWPDGARGGRPSYGLLT